MQNTSVKAQVIIRKPCGISLSKSPDSKLENTVEFKRTVRENTDSWFMKKPESDERVGDIGASNSK
jgi:hypothetical protein